MFLFVLCAIVAVANAATRTCYGDINNLQPTGKKIGGVAASNADAQNDIRHLEKQRSCYQASADKYCIQASVIAAIASRESRGGSLLVRTGGYGDGGRAWGIMQCDVQKSRQNCKGCPWDSCCHIDMMTDRVLIPFIRQVRDKHPSWTQDMVLQGGIAAYNFGVGNVRSWPGLDRGSTGDDYSNDVVARAKYLKANGWN